MELIVKKADTRKTTSLLKRYFKKEFGITTSVKTSKYSMGSSLDVKYELGPDESLLSPIVDQLQYGRFNGMDDIYEYDSSKGSVVLEGYELENWKYTGVTQSVPDDLLYKFAKTASDAVNIHGVFKLESRDDLHTNFKERWGSAWNWKDILYQNWKVRNFNTQNPDDIQNISLIEDRDDFDFIFSYEINGIQYRTDQYVKPSSNNYEVEKVDVPEGEIQIIEYSDKAIAVIGNTKPIKDTLKELGGRFNFRLSCGAGWIFPKTKLDELTKALS